VDKKRVRVAGPFTVESLSPHRTLAVGADDELIDYVGEARPRYGAEQSFENLILENLRTAGVQQAHKDDRITFTSLMAWPGRLVCGEGRYMEGDTGKRAAIFIGPEFGTVQRADLAAAAREAADAGFDVLVACAFNFEAHTTEFSSLGRLPVLKARMNADLHMAEDLKNTGKGNLFVVFGEPDIELLKEQDGRLRVKVKGVDVFKPQTGEVVSDGPDGIACWFIDTDYNEESFFVRHAYFLGANDPYNSLKTSLKSEIDAEAWASLRSDTSRPFATPKSRRIAVKVINHLGDEVMKVFRV
jgi:adenine-specific DNA-methyltransferase